MIFLAKGWTRLALPVQAGKIVMYWWAVDESVSAGRAHLLHVNGRIEQLRLSR